MSTEQRETLDTILQKSAFPADIDSEEQRRQLRELSSARSRVPQVFQACRAILDEGAAAVDRAGQYLSARLAGARSSA